MADVTYRGYTIRVEPYKALRGASRDTLAIYRGEQWMTCAASAGLAKRVIDERVRTGRWEDMGNRKDTTHDIR